ncbi:hypothetical protein [Micromonospora sp. NPDC049497]|uniref:hypothetical protein n=1 Tax=Micromonospora sp. NPDC049497 TaxID=3364273 RepID=UPI003787E6E2
MSWTTQLDSARARPGNVTGAARSRESAQAGEEGADVTGAALRVPDPERTRELRRRHLAVLLAGLAVTDPPLPGPPPAAGEFDWRWRREE